MRAFRRRQRQLRVRHLNAVKRQIGKSAGRPGTLTTAEPRHQRQMHRAVFGHVPGKTHALKHHPVRPAAQQPGHVIGHARGAHRQIRRRVLVSASASASVRIRGRQRQAGEAGLAPADAVNREINARDPRILRQLNNHRSGKHRQIHERGPDCRADHQQKNEHPGKQPPSPAALPAAWRRRSGVPCSLCLVPVIRQNPLPALLMPNHRRSVAAACMMTHG